MRWSQIIIERHRDGYVGYPVGLSGVIVGQGDTYDKALLDTRSAIRFHCDSFGRESLDSDLIDAFVADAEVS